MKTPVWQTTNCKLKTCNLCWLGDLQLIHVQVARHVHAKAVHLAENVNPE
jgi:hypothetical protein